VIDDAHTAAGTEFDVLLSAAIHELPPDVALVIASRREPEGPLLDHVVRGTLRLVEDKALAFSEDEAVELLDGRIERSRARHLRAQVDGWAAGMLLFAQAASASDGAGRIAPSGRERIRSYFDERVVASLTSSEQRTLAAAALLPDVDAGALERMGLAGGEALELLRKQRAFVTRLDRQPPSWRLHELLREALLRRFDEGGIGDAQWRTDTRRAAAALAAERGLTRHAVELWLAAGDPSAARAAAEAAAAGLVKSMRSHELDAIADALASVVVESFPLQFALAESAWQRNDARTAVARFELAYGLSAGDNTERDRLRTTAAAIAAILEGWQDFEGTDRWMERLRRHMDARATIVDPEQGLRVDSAWLQATNMIWSHGLGGHEPVVARMLDALRSDDRLDPNVVIAASSVLMEAAGYRLSDGTLFREIVAATAPWLGQASLAPLAKAGWLVTYAPLGRRWPTPGVQLPAADPAAALELAIELAHEHGGRSLAFSAALFLAHMAVATNDRAKAGRRLETLREFVDASRPRQAINLLEVESNVQALHGDWPQARATIARARELAGRHGFPSSQMWNIEIYEQRLAIASGAAREARETLLRNSARYPEGNRREFALILADVAAAAESLQAAGAIPPELVAAVMQRARAYDWPGFAAHLGPVAARLCSDAIRLGLEPDFARRVVRDRHLVPPAPYEEHWPWAMRVRALGGFEVEVDGEPLDWGPRAQRKPLDLLKLLVAQGPGPADAAVVIDALWPDADGAAARASFDMTVMRLRKLLQRHDALRLDGSHIGLDTSVVWVDVFAFLAGATDAYPGQLFGNDAVQSWWAAAREKLRQRFLRRAVERGRALERQGRSDEALQLFEAGLAQDALAEELYQGAIRCYIATHRPADALRVFRRCREQLSIVLGVAPSASTQALVTGIHGG
jgi:DNA-binding SARP family transcriptional activator